MIIDVLAYLAAAVALVAAGARIWTTRGSVRRGEVWTLCLGGGLLALAAVLLAPASVAGLARLEQATGVDVGKLLGDALRMGGAGAAGLLATLIRDDRGPSSKAWLRWFVVVEVLLVCAFLGAGFRSGDGGRYVEADRGLGVFYDAIRLTYPVLALGLFLLAIWPYARTLPPGTVRAGSRILAAAAVIGIAWTSWTVDDIVGLARTGRQNLGDDVPSVVLEIAFVTAIGAGMTVTFWERMVHGPLGWVRALRSYRAMAPLWLALCGPARHTLAEQLNVRPWRASTARYRRVIEIRDAQLALRPYEPRAAVGGAATPADEAAAIVAALHAFTTGGAHPLAQVEDATTGRPPTSSVAVSIDAEAQRLAQVARAFALARRG